MISKSVKALYIKNQPIWQGVDQINTSYEVDKDLYLQFKEFLFNYFQLEESQFDEQDDQSANRNQENGHATKWCSSIQNALTKKNENLKAAAGGPSNKVHVGNNGGKYNSKGNRGSQNKANLDTA